MSNARTHAKGQHHSNYPSQQHPHSHQQQQQQQQQQHDPHPVILVTAAYDHVIRFWDATNTTCLRTIQHPDAQVNKLCISPDKQYLAAASNPHVRLYDINSGHPNPVVSFKGHTSNVTAVAFHCEGKWMVTASEDHTVKIWDIRCPDAQRIFDHKAPVNDVVIHPNQGELISCDQNGSIKLWDIGESSCTRELVPEEDIPVRSVTVANDGSSLIAANNTGNCYVWKMTHSRDFTDFQPITKFAAHEKYITKCVLSPDVKHLATCSADSTVKIWKTDNYSFELETTLVGHERWVWDCAFSADSEYLVTASSDKTARLWNLSSGNTVKHYDGHQKACVCVALNDFSM
ncbi:TOR complex subunit lst8 [Linnemannia elongata]|nr:TOR complex subunit lst8 [Linnemannia elongata]